MIPEDIPAPAVLQPTTVHTEDEEEQLEEILVLILDQIPELTSEEILELTFLHHELIPEI